MRYNWLRSQPLTTSNQRIVAQDIPDNKVHGANMGPTCVLSAPGGTHVGPINVAIRDPTVMPWPIET